MVRIRYKKDSGDRLITPVYLMGKDTIQMMIHTSCNNKYVSVIKNDELYNTEPMKDKSLAYMKKYVKSYLKSSGVVFEDEVRQKELK